MRETLVTIDHDFLGWPIQVIWWVLVAAAWAWTARTQGRVKAGGQVLPIGLTVSAILYFVVPFLEIKGLDLEDPLGPEVVQGLAIRGYGVFLTLAILAATAVVVIRSRQVGLNVDAMLSLCFWMVVVGIVGARLYYVIQKWDEFEFKNFGQFVVSLLDMTKGGLVVYGSLFGGVIVLALSHWRWRLPTRLVLDVVAPAMLVGLAIGRIGCLMNGCCFGGECSPDFGWGLQFPVGSPVYMEQLERGKLLGLKGDYDPAANPEFPLRIEAIEAEGLTAGLPLQVGDQVRIQTPGREYLKAVLGGQVDLPLKLVIVRQSGGADITLAVNRLPRASLKVHPAQIYATLGAGLVALILWFWFPYRRFDGQLFAALLILYPISRILEEEVRVDELGLFGTRWSAGQLTSFFLIVCGFGLWIGFSRSSASGETRGLSKGKARGGGLAGSRKSPIEPSSGSKSRDSSVK